MSETLSSRAESREAFNAYYAQKIAPALAALEGVRQQRMRLVIALLAFAALGLVALLLADAIAGATALPGDSVQLAAFTVMFAALLSAFFAYSGVYGRYKQVLTGGVCAYLGLDYERRRFDFPVERFNAILPFYDQERLEDRISGQFRGVDFELCEGRFRKKKNTRKAMLLKFSFDKPFRGRTVVAPDTGLIGNLIERLRQEGDIARLESMEFEDRYEVFTSDQAEARYLLTPRFMERVMSLADQVNNRKGLALEFSQRQLLITIRLGEHAARFEPGHIFRAIDDGEQRALQIMAQLDLVSEIIAALDLAAPARTEA